MAKHIILGAGGIIANGLTKLLLQEKEQVKLVSRNPPAAAGASTYPADLTNFQQTSQAIESDSIVYLCVGLPYDYSIWRTNWPKIMNHVIDACKVKRAKLVFFDNVYMYGKVQGPMTESLPYNPCSKKGDLRARLATQLMSEVRKGNLTAIIARAADFYGPGADKTSLPNRLVFANLRQHRKAQWLVNPRVKHSFTYTPDAAKGLYLLARNSECWDQVWHLPTATGPLTGEQFIGEAATLLHGPTACFTLRPWMIKAFGIFHRTVGELGEMLYQYEADYVFDSKKFNEFFQFQPTSYGEGITSSVRFPYQ